MSIATKDETKSEKDRVSTGAFYTPKSMVDLMHSELDLQLGSNWREEYAVWDCSCGTGNLTAGRKFKELYLSTIDAQDLTDQDAHGVNENATKFQFDFMFDSVDLLPPTLMDSLREKPFLWLNNPPYISGASMYKGWKNTRKIFDAKESIYSSEMSFITRMIQLSSNAPQVVYAFFCKPRIFQGVRGKKIRDQLDSDFLAGHLVRSSAFKNTSSCWGCLASIWRAKR